MGRAERKARRAAKRQRRRDSFARIKLAFNLARKHDRWLVPLLIITPLVVLGAVIGIGLLIDQLVYFVILGVGLAMLATLIVFGRRASAAAYAEVEGRPGAAAGVLQSLRGAWRSQPAIAVTRNQDLVHRAVGRPGVVLVAEGLPHRVNQLIVQEKKRVARIAPDIPIYDMTVGDGPGQVPLRRLQKDLRKLPRNLKPGQVRLLDERLRALASGPPLPKGPLPQPGKIPKGMRGNIRGR